MPVILPYMAGVGMQTDLNGICEEKFGTCLEKLVQFDLSGFIFDWTRGLIELAFQFFFSFSN